MELNKVYQGDCLEGMKQIKDNSIDLIVTDPPYYIENLKEDMREQTLRESSKNNIFFNEFDHFENKEEFQNFIKTVLMEFKRILKPKAQVYMFFSYHHIDWAMAYIKEHFRFYKPLIWYKPDTMGVFPNQYGCNYEVILWFRKNSTAKDDQYESKLNIGNSQRDVFTFKSTLQSYRKECGFHPTPKPVKLIRQLVKNGSNKGDLIFDAFMDSGTTAIAAKQTQRNFIGFEKNPDYIKICERRLSQDLLISFFEVDEDEQLEEENEEEEKENGKDESEGQNSELSEGQEQSSSE